MNTQVFGSKDLRTKRLANDSGLRARMLTFRPFTNEDLPQMLEWLLTEHVIEWWNNGRHTLEAVTAEYGVPEEGLGRFILEIETDTQKKAIGYFQHYEMPDRVIGIDQFIGDPECVNRGLGTEAVKLFVQMLDDKYHPRSIFLDPEPENRRAIRCYEKAGFRYLRTAPGSEGKVAYMMQLDLVASHEPRNDS